MLPPHGVWVITQRSPFCLSFQRRKTIIYFIEYLYFGALLLLKKVAPLPSNYNRDARACMPMNMPRLI